MHEAYECTLASITGKGFSQPVLIPTRENLVYAFAGTQSEGFIYRWLELREGVSRPISIPTRKNLVYALCGHGN